MTTKTDSFEKLIEEFSNIRVEIEIGPRSFAFSESAEYNEDGFIEVDGSIEDENIYEFFVKFQNEDKVYFNNYNNVYSDYLKSLNELRLDFYKEINQEISDSNNKFHLLNLLSEYKIRFLELFDNYYVCKPVGTENLKGNRIIQYHYSDDKPILDYNKERILDKYINIQFGTIEKIITYLDEKINLIKFQTYEEKHISTPTPDKKSLGKRFYEKESFELNPDLFDSESTFAEKINNFKEALYRSGYITQIDLRFFIKVFKNQIFTQPIVWTGTPNELYYLIKNLYSKNIIIRFKNYWQVACKCFLAYDKKTKVCNAYYLQRCKSPTRGDQLRKLNSVIDTLK